MCTPASYVHSDLITFHTFSLANWIEPMSADDRSVATTYAGTLSATIFEMETGLVDRGADLSWLSQYPYERECCFPPLTGLQVLGTHVEMATLIVQQYRLVKLNPGIRKTLLNMTSTTFVGESRLSPKACMRPCGQCRAARLLGTSGVQRSVGG